MARKEYHAEIKAELKHYWAFVKAYYLKLMVNDNALFIFHGHWACIWWA